ncbi:ATP-grasp domain-containing protein [Erwinia sp. P6884]|uniref:ATP-grasp domain-containing protein n=1 Tax=Erwinia sp. P6884 TaxID=3141450 RepID=UPI00318F2C4E
MGSAIWFMEGLSCQRDILTAVQQARAAADADFRIIASHRQPRLEILGEADYAYLEPAADEARLAFIRHVVDAQSVRAIHTGKNYVWFEENRKVIESLGVRLTTGALDHATFELADDKYAFSQHMKRHGLPVVAAKVFSTADELACLLHDHYAQDATADVLPCIKPVQGIYGMGFWMLDKNAPMMACFQQTDRRRVHPDTYLHALKEAESAGTASPPMLFMPWLPGPERSVDMVVERGKVLAAVSRCKTSEGQVLEQSGEAYELAIACAEVMKADGLINVQTRHFTDGKPYLLETNLRPSGGVGYTLHSGVNLPGLFALRQLGLADESAMAAASHRFRELTVKPTHAVQPVPSALPTLLTYAAPSLSQVN